MIPEWLKRVWSDPVWSKVIAQGILSAASIAAAALVAAGLLFYHYRNGGTPLWVSVVLVRCVRISNSGGDCSVPRILAPLNGSMP
jgi:hypothetical protein